MQAIPNHHPDPAVKKLLTYLRQHPEVVAKSINHPDDAVNTIADQDRNSLRKAAVLIAIIEPDLNNAAEVLLTVRSKNLRSHPGQISLPGGTSEDNDEDIIDTALREAEEEVGIKASEVDVLGVLGETGFTIRILCNTRYWSGASGLRLLPPARLKLRTYSLRL